MTNAPHTDAPSAPISLDDLAVFVAVARAQSFAGAGIALGIDRSRISRIISRLEEQLGVALFARTTRVVRLTHEGQTLLDRVQPGVEALAEATRAAGQQARELAGEVTLTTTAEIAQHLLAPCLPGLRAALPGITLHILITEAVLDVIADDVDIALRTGDPGAATLRTRTLGQLHAAFYAAPEYLARRGTPDSPAALAHHERVWPAPPRGAASFQAEQPLMPHIAAPFHVALAIALAAGGVALLPRFMAAPHVAQRTLQEVLADHPAPVSPAPLYLITRPEQPQPERVRAVCDWLRQSLTPSMSQASP